MEVPLDVEVADVDDDRAAVGAGERIRRLQELGDDARHFFAGQRAVDFDRGLTRERCGDALAHSFYVRGFFFERSVDQFSEERLDVVANELGREGGDGERVAGETLDVEADGAQLFDVRLEDRALVCAGLLENGSEKLLGDRRARFDAREVAVV